MAYDEEAVNSKLSTLNDSQDSIVTVAQWIMFHKRHAPQTARLWLARLKESPTAKRLILVYLANEVVQQSKARSKTEFVDAFQPIIIEAATVAYRGSSQDVQGKLRRVIEVWRHRSVFEKPVLDEMDSKIREMDKERGNKAGGGGGKLGGSLFGGGSGGVPTELEGVAKSQGAVSKAEAGLSGKASKAEEEHARMTDPNTPIPTAPMHAAQLNKLMKNLAEAQGAVEASINARKELVAGLEKLVQSNKAKLAEDEATASSLKGKWEDINVKRKEVEDAIMHGTSVPTTPNATNGFQTSTEMQAPEAEGFTPPPPDVEEFTPPPPDPVIEASAAAPLLGEAEPMDSMMTSTTGAENLTEYPPVLTEPPPVYEPPAAPLPTQDSAATAANNLVNTMYAQTGQTRQASADIPADPRLKRRKLSHKASQNREDDVFGSAEFGGVDDESVSKMLES